MARRGIVGLAALMVLCAVGLRAEAAPGVQSFDADWRFFKGDAKGAEAVDFDDSAWRELDVPHDWSIEGPYDRDAAAGRGGGYLPSGVGWYRKHFKLSADDSNKKAFVEFDGIMSHSDVYLNGVKLGTRPSGYASFRYELTPGVGFAYVGAEGRAGTNPDPVPQLNGDDADNVIAVRVDASRQPASRWYAGAGIYRHARLVVSTPPYIEPGRLFVTTRKVSREQATIRISAGIVVPGQDDSVRLRFKILDSSGAEVATAKPGLITTGPYSFKDGGLAKTFTELTLSNPELWSLDEPRLYTTVVEAQRGDQVTEVSRTRFGIREFHFDADTGFWLNGENMKIKGVCLHHDGGAVGSAVPKAVWTRRLAELKRLGVNGVRTAHNIPTPEFLDVCDELGFVVMHEVFDSWRVGKNHAEKGYNIEFADWWERDQTAAVLRDRNHPSIILYSMGNEIHDNLRSPAGFEQFTKMRDLNKKLDPTRPVTQAVFRPNQSSVYESGFAELMDVVGQNYRENELVAAHKQKPTRKVIGTENGHDRGVWLPMRDNKFFAGEFLWTGIEYMGESDWPYTTWGDALLDRAGFVKPMGLQRQSWWSDEPMVAIVRDEAAAGGASGRGGVELVDHWSPRDEDSYDEARVTVYSNCEEVELVLNGESVGKKTMPKDAGPATFRVAYNPGTVEAVGYNGGKEVARQTLKSCGEPAKLKLTADKDSCSTAFDDVVHVTVEVVDAEGVRCPWADKLISLAIDGPGKLVGVDNADPQSHESFQKPQRRAYRGRVLAIVRPKGGSGSFALKATAEGLEAGEVVIFPIGGMIYSR